MVTILLPIRSYPKPAGAVYNGKMTMLGSRGGKYGEWTKIAKGYIVKNFLPNPVPKIGSVYGIYYLHVMIDRRAGDVPNLIGAITDILVKTEIIKDDSPQHLPRIAGEIKYLSKPAEPEILLVICENRQEWQFVLNFFASQL